MYNACTINNIHEQYIIDEYNLKSIDLIYKTYEEMSLAF